MLAVILVGDFESAASASSAIPAQSGNHRLAQLRLES